MASRIHLRDLKMTKYSKSFDKILAKAKEASTNQEEQLQFVANTVLNRLFRKQSKKCKKSKAQERHTPTYVCSQIRQMIPKRPRSNLDKPEASKSETTSEDQDDEKAKEESTKAEDLVIPFAPQEVPLELNKGPKRPRSNLDKPQASKSKTTSEDQDDEKAKEETTKAEDLVIPFPPQEVPLELNKGKEAQMTYNEVSPSSSGNHDQMKRKREGDQDEDDEYKKKRKQKARKPRRDLASPLTSEPPEMPLESNKVKKVMTHNKDSPSSSGNDDQRKSKRQRSDVQDEDNDHKKKARKARSLSPSEIPEMPLELKNRVEALNAFQIEFVIQKTMTSSDLRTGQTRLTFPQNQVRADAQDFRKELDKQFEEYADKDRRKEKGPKGVMCKLIEPCLQVNNLRLIKWYYNSCCSYVLNGGWNRTCSNEDNGLTENDLIQVWSFRVRDNEADNEDQGKLWFALVNKGKDHANASSTNEESSMPRKQSD